MDAPKAEPARITFTEAVMDGYNGKGGKQSAAKDREYHKGEGDLHPSLIFCHACIKFGFTQIFLAQTIFSGNHQMGMKRRDSD